MAIGSMFGAMAVPSRTLGAQDAVVETQWGRVRGVRQGGVHVFRGLRYGAPTGGDNRFMPPRDPAPWAGVADAAAFGDSAPQSNPNPPSASGPAAMYIMGRIPRPAPAPDAPPAPGESEDCLFLNVWTAGINDGRRRPVMVFLHGGFFRSGSGSNANAANLAARGDVVAVSVNHRLNIFGFNHLADILGPEFRHSGNAGMLDIIAALKWVRTNIEAFGGDPARVMVFGPSGGGMKTAFLMASPAARGLIHRAGVQSGPGLKLLERDEASRAADMALRELGLTAANAVDVRRIGADRLLAAFHTVNDSLPILPNGDYSDLGGFAPVIDAELLPHHPFHPEAAPLTADIPMLIGWNREDMTFFMGADDDGFALDEAGLWRRLDGLLGDAADEGLALYRAADPHLSPSGLYIRIYSDYSIGHPTMLQAERHAAAGNAGTYLYRLDWQSPALDGALGATHSLDDHFVFDRTQAWPAMTGDGPQARALAAQMRSAWAAFAAGGAPEGSAGLPHWPEFDAASRRAMIFDAPSRVADGFMDAQQQFFSTRLPRWTG